MLHLLLKLICEKERICMTHHFLGFAHGGQLSWVNCSQVSRPRAAPELMVTPSLPAAGLRFSMFCLVKLRKKDSLQPVTCLEPWVFFLPWEPFIWLPPSDPQRPLNAFTQTFICPIYHFLQSGSMVSGFPLLLSTLLTDSEVMVVKWISWPSDALLPPQISLASFCSWENQILV